MEHVGMQQAVAMLNDAADNSIVSRVSDLALQFLLISEDADVPLGDRCAAKVAHDRLNVAAFELRHCRDKLNERESPEPVDVELVVEHPEQATLF